MNSKLTYLCMFLRKNGRIYLIFLRNPTFSNAFPRAKRS